MNISDNGVKFISDQEGFRSSPYLDIVGVCTIGYGSTHYTDGTKVTMQDLPITELQGQAMLRNYVDTKDSPWISQNLPNLTQNEFDALCSFCYNLGLGDLENSSAKNAIIAGSSCATIATDMDKWDMAAGRVIQGLLERRQREADLYCNGNYGPNIN